MKVNTDAVLLGAWTQPNNSATILDIGTGTGVIAMMLAQKSKAKILAIDIDTDSAEQAIENVLESKFNTQIEVKNISFQNFILSSNAKFDLIITNPPYFTHSLKNNNKKLTIARHNDALTFIELLTGVKKVMSKKGKFNLILPTNEAKQFAELAKKEGLYLSKLLRIKTKTKSEIEKRHIMQFEFKESEFSESQLTIEDETKKEYTSEYVALTKEYYVQF
ncbi:MAG: methyltransferase domain-containing protein [Bacteroidetes bacterium]|nr:methyltransferase domain-containing protein [Bacteroidota bacterium]